MNFKIILFTLLGSFPFFIFSKTTVSTSQTQQTTYENNNSPYYTKVTRNKNNGKSTLEFCLLEKKTKQQTTCYEIKDTKDNLKVIGTSRQEFWAFDEPRPQLFQSIVQKNIPTANLKTNTQNSPPPIKQTKQPSPVLTSNKTPSSPQENLNIYPTLQCPEGTKNCQFCVHHIKGGKNIASCSKEFENTTENNRIRIQLSRKILNKKITFSELPSNGHFTMAELLHSKSSTPPSTCENNEQKIKELEAQLAALKNENCSQSQPSPSSQEATTN